MAQDTPVILCLLLQDCATDGNVLHSHVQEPCEHCFVQVGVRFSFFSLPLVRASTVLQIAVFAFGSIERELAGMPNRAVTFFLVRLYKLRLKLKFFLEKKCPMFLNKLARFDHHIARLVSFCSLQFLNSHGAAFITMAIGLS